LSANTKGFSVALASSRLPLHFTLPYLMSDCRANPFAYRQAGLSGFNPIAVNRPLSEKFFLGEPAWSLPPTLPRL
jgi:hypothetical protein